MRMAVYIHLVVFIVVNFEYIDVEAGCQGGVSRCNWVPWKSWSDCSRTCGGGTRKRSRSYCCKADLDFDDCIKDCGHSSSYGYTYSSDTQSCNNICFNGIYINGTNSCTCNDEFYGSCCGNECPHIEHCKRRRCSSSLDTKCLECNYDQKLFKKTQNDTKCRKIPQNLTLHLENPPSKDQDVTNNAVTLKCTTGCIFPTPSFIWYYLQSSDESGSKWSNSEPVTETPGQCKEFQKMFTSTLVLRKHSVLNDNADHTVRFQCGATIMNGTSDEVKTQSSVNIRFAVRVAKVSLKIGSRSRVSSLNVTDGISEIFKCTTSDSRPLPTIVWYIGQTEKKRVVGTESTLAFIPSIMDSGKEVYCKAFNIQPENKSLSSNKVSLYVRGPPRPGWQSITNTTCSIGAPVTLTFTAIAYPMPSSDGFKWYKQISNEWIPLQSNKDVQISVIGLETNLTIVNVTQANLGQYRLTVENSVGIYNQYYFLIEKDDPSVDVGKDTMNRSDFKTATIIFGIISVICIGTSAGIVIWFKRKAKGTDRKSCTKSSHQSQIGTYDYTSYETEMQECTGQVYENLPQQGRFLETTIQPMVL
ncbi:uncharacterized protein LOC132733354 [Ruditapes philippinarum]|uniref:uncharacterized protein LOC132733354 n=1 Tax=Ruditapes philippinarum TaxID=129788 RepID=UPI00295A61B7|nr:uncharacterized protein LOC132733354 [Ruditapes philippinarum]